MYSTQMRRLITLVLLCASLASVAPAQQTDSPSAATSQPSEAKMCSFAHVDRCLLDLAHDEAGIWTSPLRLREHDAIWAVPFAGATAAALYYDAEAQKDLGNDQHSIDTSRNIAKAAPYALASGVGGLYLLGALRHDDKLSETGRLGGEAIINALIVGEAIKLGTNRERPYQGDGTGKFWPHGTSVYRVDSSFPSEHAMATWAFARIVSSEYPGPLTKILAYGFASTISIARVTGRNHFPSDAFVGSGLGYLIGGYVYRHYGGDTGNDTSFMIVPAVDQRTHAFGGTLSLDPGFLVQGLRTLLPGHSD